MKEFADVHSRIIRHIHPLASIVDRADELLSDAKVRSDFFLRVSKDAQPTDDLNIDVL